MNVKLLTEHHFEFLSLTGGCTGSSESTLVKMPNCWKSNDHLVLYLCLQENTDILDYATSCVYLCLSSCQLVLHCFAETNLNSSGKVGINLLIQKSWFKVQTSCD